MSTPDPFGPPDEEHVQRERRKARELRDSQWWKNLRARNRCHWCGGEFPAKSLTMDHVVPIARGGASTKSNVVPSCKGCNTSKRDHLPTEWAEHMGRIEEG